jgi:hypothetical protein
LLVSPSAPLFCPSDDIISRTLSEVKPCCANWWSFATLAVAAKNVITSVPDYLVIETAFTAVQWIMVGPLNAYAFAGAPHKAPVAG